MLTCVDPDPYWEYGSGHESNTDPDPQNWLKGHKYIYFFVCASFSYVPVPGIGFLGKQNADG